MAGEERNDILRHWTLWGSVQAFKIHFCVFEGDLQPTACLQGCQATWFEAFEAPMGQRVREGGLAGRWGGGLRSRSRRAVGTGDSVHRT